MKKDIKIAFFDIDGTIIDMDSENMTQRMSDTLNELQKNGIKICICTGRGPTFLPKFEGVDFDAYLTYNGSLSYEKDTIIYSHPLKNSDVAKIVENIRNLGKTSMIATAATVEANGMEKNLKDYVEIANNEMVISDHFEELMQGEVYQMMSGLFAEEHEAAMEGVEAAKITAWWPRGVDIIPDDSDKGVAVGKVLEYYGFTKDQAIAFGDGSNDIPMLMAVGLGVAMENGTDDTKAIADDICPSCLEEGVTQYCKKLGLI